MNMFRRFAYGLASTLLPFLLFSFGLLISFERVLGQPGPLKHALAENKAYAGIVDGFLNESEKNTTNDAELPAGRPEVKAAIAKAFPPQTLQPQAEQAIDDVYRWLHGSDQQLQLTFNIGPQLDILLKELTNVAKEKALTLPSCPPGTLPPSDFNVYSAECLPTGLTPELVASQTTAKLQQSELFKQSSFSPSNIKDEKGQTFNERFAKIPPIFQNVIRAIYGGGILALVLLVTIVFLAPDRRQGLARTAKLCLGVGISTVILAGLSVFATSRLQPEVTATSFQVTMFETGRMLLSDARTWWLGYGILLIVIAVIVYIALRILKEKDQIEHNNALPPEKRPHVVVN